MIYIKNKLCILILFTTCILPLGGIGISGIGNMHAINPDNEIEGPVTLTLESQDWEGGLNWFLYFDIPLTDFSIEYSNESKLHIFTGSLDWDTDLAVLPSGIDAESINGDIPTNIKSQYFTLRKEFFGLSIPFLAKGALHIGGGYNTHNSLTPTIGTLKKMAEVNEVENLFLELDNNWNTNTLEDLWNEYSIDSNGIHLQAGLQGSILMLNLFANAKYTFIFNQEESSIKSFPGLSIGIAYGI